MVIPKADNHRQGAAAVPDPGRSHPQSARPSSVAEFVLRWPTSAVVVVDSYGEIDATNSATMTDYALMGSTRGHGMVLDLAGVNFIGIEGFSALHRVAVVCAHTDTAWSLVPSAAVSRLLRVCDPHGWLPAVESVEVALAIVQDRSLSATARRTSLNVSTFRV
jgi:anti-anti-sigma factor